MLNKFRLIFCLFADLLKVDKSTIVPKIKVGHLKNSI